MTAAFEIAFTAGGVVGTAEGEQLTNEDGSAVTDESTQED